MRLAPLFLLLLASCTATPEKSAQAAPEKSDSVTRLVLARLKDPDSARFGPTVRSSDGRSWCGTVNARNGYGGFTGMQSWVYSPDRRGDEFYLFEGDNQRQRIVASILEERGCPLTPGQRNLAAAERYLTE